MKAQELRIGNYIRLMLNHSDFNDICIELADFNLIANESRNHTYEPIPITEEWLLKFGFKRYVNEFRISVGEGLEFCVGDNSFFDISQEIDGEVEKVYFTDIFKYVHQLQNLYFAITGEELTCNTK